MGDRISIQFEKDGEKSIVLFSHWDGLELKEEAEEFAGCIEQGNRRTPIERLEPQTVMIAFVQYYLCKKEPIKGNYYFGFHKNDGDNSDNGHHIIKL